jgi:ABC-type transport system involved in multi-copper enzyme maturation permease subunit
MRLDAGRLRAVVRKEFRVLLRNRFIIGTMTVLPVVFLITPMIEIFRLSPGIPASVVQRFAGSTFLLLLIIPVVVPAAIAAYSVVGEREQGTLEPLLTTPLRREELLLGKAVAAFVPSVGISYLLFALVIVCAQLLAADPAVASALVQSSQLVGEFLFAPLLAGWSIWVGIAVSARASDVRVAQQLGTLASLPPLVVIALIDLQVLTPSVTLALAFALILLVADVVMFRVVSAMFDRERLLTGARSTTPRPSRSSG